MRCGISSGSLEHLEALLRQTPASAPKLIAVESVYCMDADIAPTVVHLGYASNQATLATVLSYRQPRFSTRCEGFHTSRVGQNGLITAASQRIGERIQAFSRCRAMKLKVVLPAINAARCKFRFGQ